MVTHRLSSLVEALSLIQEHAGLSVSARPTTSSLSSIDSSQPSSSSHHPIGCPFCGVSLRWKHLYVHLALLHGREVDEDEASGGPKTCCFICKEPGVRLLRHIKSAHNPFSMNQPVSSLSPRASELLRSHASLISIGRNSVTSINTANSRTVPVFVVVVVRRESDGNFLLIDEIAGQGWWLPGGMCSGKGYSFKRALI
jgi:hypothetical protein